MSALTLSANVNNTIPGVAFSDIYLDEFGNIATSTDLQAVLEECVQAARTRLGECIFNTTIGIPYEQVVWTGVPNIQQFNAALRSAFLGVNGVTEIISLMISQSGNNLIYNAIIQTIYGTGVIQ